MTLEGLKKAMIDDSMTRLEAWLGAYPKETKLRLPNWECQVKNKVSNDMFTSFLLSAKWWPDRFYQAYFKKDSLIWVICEYLKMQGIPYRIGYISNTWNSPPIPVGLYLSLDIAGIAYEPDGVI